MRSDSLVHLYSVTKPLAAACALWLVDRGVLELDAPVAALWPEYAQGGKQGTTLRHLLSHQAGLLGWRAAQPLEALLDHDRAAELLAAEPAWWPPGTAHGEHALCYGTLLGEVVRRADGRSLGALFREEFAQRWDLDVHIGLSAADGGRSPIPIVFGPPRCSTAATSPIGWRSTTRRRSRTWTGSVSRTPVGGWAASAVRSAGRCLPAAWRGPTRPRGSAATTAPSRSRRRCWPRSTPCTAQSRTDAT